MRWVATDCSSSRTCPRHRSESVALCRRLLGEAQETQPQPSRSAAALAGTWPCPRCAGPMIVIPRLSAEQIRRRCAEGESFIDSSQATPGPGRVRAPISANRRRVPALDHNQPHHASRGQNVDPRPSATGIRSPRSVRHRADPTPSAVPKSHPNPIGAAPAATARRSVETALSKLPGRRYRAPAPNLIAPGQSQ
jgi:hypothetical protein